MTNDDWRNLINHILWANPIALWGMALCASIVFAVIMLAVSVS